MQVDEGEKFLMTKEEALARIATLTGGRSAEELIFNTCTSGASNDIEQATKIARAMVTRYGMSSSFDMIALETVTNQYLGGDTSLACSPETAHKIDDEINSLVKKSHEKAVSILTENISKLHELAHFLLEKETITGEECNNFFFFLRYDSIFTLIASNNYFNTFFQIRLIYKFPAVPYSSECSFIDNICKFCT